MPEPISLSLLEFLAWVDARDRCYGETMEAWRSSCPRLTVWEDALADGLVQLGREGRVNGRTVTLTTRGREILATSRARNAAPPDRTA
jgi:hypothetical protein